MLDHYKTLGIPLDATQEEVKKAFRRKTAEHHPDRGGYIEDMQKVNEAYATLSDPEKRMAYDNGETLSDSEEVIQQASLVMLTWALGDVLNSGVDFADITPVAAVRHTLEQLQEAFRTNKRDTEGELRKLKKLQAGLVYKGTGENPLEVMLTARIARAEATLQKTEADYKAVERALERLREYSFKGDGSDCGEAVESVDADMQKLWKFPE